MKDFQQKERESAGIIINDKVDLSVSLMEYEDLDYFIHRLINLELPPFVVSQIYQQQDEMIQEKSEKTPHLNQISQKILTYNRKEKSLSQLTKKFIDKFEGAKCNRLVIDQVTSQMNVQRRRIYDIINIMQSLNVVKKIKKNIYQWKGLIQALKTIDSYDGVQEYQQMYAEAKSKKERSLQSLSTQFLRLLSKAKYNSKSKKEILTLQQASLIMMNDQLKDSKKTKVRRLYDIVNVFKCMGLVRKIKVEGCKPGYEWMGTRSLVKIIENKSSECFRSISSEQDSDQQQNQIHNEKNLKDKKCQILKSLQVFQSDQRQNENFEQRKNIKKNKSTRSNSNKVQTQKQDQIGSPQQIKLKKSQSFSISIKNSQHQIGQKQNTKLRHSRFSSYQSCRQKNSCSPLTTATATSNVKSNKKSKKLNFFSEKNKQQEISSHNQTSNFKTFQIYQLKRQVQQKKQEQYSQQIQIQKLEKSRGKVPKRLQKKNSQLEASQSIISSLIRGYRRIGLTTLDQFILRFEQSLYGVKDHKSMNNNQNLSIERRIQQEEKVPKKSFQRKKQSKSLQKLRKCTSLLSNQKVQIDQSIENDN